MKRVVLIVGLFLPAAPLFAQQQTQTTKADPIQCWWRTSSGAVRVGEPFAVVLTCAVLETGEVKVVPDQTKLEPTVVQFAPFEVTGGSHGADLRTDDRRFFQYEYRMRLIAENLFGKDVVLPETKINYRVQSKTGQGTAIEGRDQIYVLPAQSIRVLSLVPSDASDIRDAGSETFAEIDQRAFRANLLTVTGGILFALAALLGILAVVRLIAKYRRPATAAERVMPDFAVLRGVGRELSAVRRERQGGGWTSELAARASAAMRVIASYATGRGVSKLAQSDESSAISRHATAGSPQSPDGQLLMYTGFPKRKRVIVSGSATSVTVAREVARVSTNGGAKRAQELESLEQALTRFTAAQYGRNGSLDDSALDESLDAGVQLLRRLKLERTWPMRRFVARRGAAPHAASTITRVWSR
jgi:hypothetical protein